LALPNPIMREAAAGVRGANPGRGPASARWRVRRLMMRRPLHVLISVTVLSACAAEPERGPPAEPVFVARPDLQRVAAGPAVELYDPTRLALARNGKLYVVDRRLCRVFEGQFKGDVLAIEEAFVIPGTPGGIETIGSLLVVGNRTAASVDVYGPNGKWIRSIGGPGTVSDPKEMAADAEADRLFVLDGKLRVIKVFEFSTGTWLADISQPGRNDFDLQQPMDLVVDPERQEVLVSDYGYPANFGGVPPSVKIFGYDGSNSKVILGAGTYGGGKFSRPQGLALDRTGRLYVVDAGGEVVVLDRDTEAVLSRIGGAGTGPNDLWVPLDVVVDEKLGVLVTNNRMKRVQRFVVGG